MAVILHYPKPVAPSFQNKKGAFKIHTLDFEEHLMVKLTYLLIFLGELLLGRRLIIVSGS